MRTALLALGCLIGIAGASWAQPDDAERKAGAEAAFQQGNAMLAKGRVEEACMAFKQSQALDPQFGTQYNLARCYETWGRLASAWGELTELAARDTNPQRRAKADQLAKALAPRLARLLLRVAEPVPGLVIRRDGADITALIGVAAPVDPGMWTVVASAPGYETWNAEVAVTTEGETKTVEIPRLRPTPEAPAAPVSAPTVAAEPPPSSARRRRVGLIIGGAGVAAIGVGAWFGMQAWGSFDDAETECQGDVTDCRGDLDVAQADVDDSRTQAWISTLGIGIGVAAVAGGAYWYLTAPRNAADETVSTRISPLIAPDRAGLLVAGHF